MSSRRDALRMIGAAAAASVIAPELWLPRPATAQPAPGALPGCIVTPQQTEGPYFVDNQLRRGDLRLDPATGTLTPGMPLTLSITVAQLNGGGCRPLNGAIVDVWQCDAHGQYSGVADRRQGVDTRESNVLRGHQVTGADGRVEFTTIYPGWYPGRAVHIHFKVRTSESSGRAGEFTSQWYFEDTVSDDVFAAGPYAEHSDRRVRNDRDGIYRRGGRELMLALQKTDEGFHGTFDLGVRLG